MKTNSSITPLSDVEKKKLVLATLQADFNLHGEHLKILSKVMEKIGYVDDTLTLVEIAGFISEGTLLASAASTINVVTLFFSPIAGILMLVNANESAERTYGMRAVAYTITAWAYNEFVLAGSDRILQNMQQGFPRVPAKKIQRYNIAWKKASNAMLAHFASLTISKKISKRSLQILLKALGDNDKRALCLEIMR